MFISETTGPIETKLCIVLWWPPFKIVSGNPDIQPTVAKNRKGGRNFNIFPFNLLGQLDSSFAKIILWWSPFNLLSGSPVLGPRWTLLGNNHFFICIVAEKKCMPSTARKKMLRCWIWVVNVLFLRKNVFLFHMKRNQLIAVFKRNKYFDWGRFRKKKVTSTMKIIPAPIYCIFFTKMLFVTGHLQILYVPPF